MPLILYEQYNDINVFSIFEQVNKQQSHHYCSEEFYSVLNMKFQELNNYFNEVIKYKIIYLFEILMSR